VSNNIRIPKLSNVWMVERTLHKLKKVNNLTEIKQNLPNKISHQSLNLILDYLDYSKKIQRTSNGIEWIFEEDASQEGNIKNLLELLSKNKKDGMHK
jgi:hypothetical protein